MSAGLVATDRRSIFLVADSYGLVPPDGPRPQLASKIFQWPLSSGVWVVVSGYLGNWCEARDRARQRASTNSVIEAAQQISELLGEVTPKEEEAFGLVCGFRQETPECFRVGRVEKKDDPEPIGRNEFLDENGAVDPARVIVLAHGWLVSAQAVERIREGHPHGIALEGALNTVATNIHGDPVRLPIYGETI